MVVAEEGLPLDSHDFGVDGNPLILWVNCKMTVAG